MFSSTNRKNASRMIKNCNTYIMPKIVEICLKCKCVSEIILLVIVKSCKSLHDTFFNYIKINIPNHCIKNL